MRVWITRTLPGADRTADRAAGLGLVPVVEPILEVRTLDTPIDLDRIAALAFTSAHGVRAFAARAPGRDLPVFAVGDGTAEAARRAGFRDVRSAAGNVEALAERIALDAPAGPVLHSAAAAPAGDLAGELASLGVEACTVALYDTVERTWTEPDCDAALVQSARAARALAERLDPRLSRLYACQSEAVAAPLRRAGFSRTAVATDPTESALLQALVAGLGKRPPEV